MDKITESNINKVNRQVYRYYRDSFERVLDAFVGTYEEVVKATVYHDRKPTPADLYKLDTYWKMQAELAKELEKLGNKQARLMSKEFEQQYLQVYKSIAIPSQMHYSLPDKQMVTQMVNTIWAADGQTWKQRIWKNTEMLRETLNDELLHCVVTGKDSRYLKDLLTDRFNVSYGRADTLVRTELAHIQTTAAQQRYIDAGITEVQLWAEKDERRCPECGRLHKKIYPIHGQMPVPVHPKCRCCILPVFKDI